MIHQTSEPAWSAIYVRRVVHRFNQNTVFLIAICTKSLQIIITQCLLMHKYDKAKHSHYFVTLLKVTKYHLHRHAHSGEKFSV
jgi:hypothetical protein